MLKQTDIAVTEEFGNQVAPYQIRVRHIATGVEVVGNTGAEANKAALRDSLIASLEKCLPTLVVMPHPTVDNDLQAQIEALKAQVAALMAGKPVEKKKGGRPKGSKIVDGKLVAPTGAAPEGYSVLDPSKVQAAPVTAPPPARVYKPAQTVSVSNVKDIAA